MTRRTLSVIAMLLLAATPVFAQNPCTATPATTLTTNPTQVFVTLAEQTANMPGVTPARPMVDSYQIAYFAEGADPNLGANPLTSAMVARATFTLAATTTDCYRTALPLPLPPPPGTRYVAYARAHRDAFSDGTNSFAAADSPWSPVSNPFVQVPTALAAPGRLTFRQ